MTVASYEDLQNRLHAAISSLQQAEERAAAGLLALEVMHEIRNPLEALSSLMYLGMMHADQPAEVRACLEQAQDQLATISEIADQTLEFARSSHAPREADLSALAEAALRMHQKALGMKNVSVVKDLPDRLTANVHSGPMLQVLSNLVTNAIDALPPGGTLTLRLRKRSNEVRFLVADNGHGIPLDLRKVIFDPFFTTKEQFGNGLGLPLCRRIVERHEGRICMRSSVSFGRSGTTFKICLPA